MTRQMRGLRCWVMRLMTPPLPAASRPSKITTTLSPVVLDPFEHRDELDLEPEQFLFVLLVGDLPRPICHFGPVLASRGLRLLRRGLLLAGRDLCLFGRRSRLACRFLRRLRFLRLAHVSSPGAYAPIGPIAFESKSSIPNTRPLSPQTLRSGATSHRTAPAPRVGGGFDLSRLRGPCGPRIPRRSSASSRRGARCGARAR